MRKNQKEIKGNSSSELSEYISEGNELLRLCNLMALLLIKGEPQMQQVATLYAAGFSPKEIGKLLHITSHQVSVVIHQHKTLKKGKTRKPDINKGDK